uniref:Thioredoxin domain-containing protein 17 n=1 Tax=Cyanoderma ruficeps TaxID=181631 RepID=A0A8C3R599_9PASS
EQIPLLPLACDQSCECENSKSLFQTRKSHTGSDVRKKEPARGVTERRLGWPLCSRPGPAAAPTLCPHGVPGGTGGPQALPQERGEGGLAARAAPGPSGRRSNPVPPPPQGPPGACGATAAARAGQGGASASAAAAMGWEEVQVRGYSEFVRTAQSYHSRPIFALFCGDKDAEGKSWCPDCVTAEPIVRKELHNLPDESVFIYCLVGDKAYWKDPNNEFRKNLKLTGVPTLLKYGTPQKLVEEECFKAELVRMLFTED